MTTFDLRRLSLEEFHQLLDGQAAWQARARIIVQALAHAPIGTTMEILSANPRLPPSWRCRKVGGDGLEWASTTHELRTMRSGEIRSETSTIISTSWGFALEVAFGSRAFPQRVDLVIKTAWGIIQAADEPWPLASEAQPIHLRQVIQVPDLPPATPGHHQGQGLAIPI